MAFTAAPKVTLVADNLVRLSNANDELVFGLVAGAAGTISLFGAGAGADIELPEAFKPRDYGNALRTKVDLQSSIQVDVVPTDQQGFVAIPYTVVKTGTTLTDFLITITNTGDAGEEAPTIEFELYIRFH